MYFFKILAIFVAACFAASATSGLSGVTPSEHYNNSAVLDANGNYFLFWSFNSSHVTFEVHVRTRGYIGFGLSTNGNMYPADVIVGGVQNGVTYFKDRHTTAHASPVIDSSQDWFLISGKENDFGTVLKFVRKIDTCDDDDIVINDGTLRVIYSYHPDDPADHNSLPYHGDRRGTKSLSLLSSNKPPVSMDNEETKIVEFTAGNFIVPDDYTTYWCFGFQLPDLGGKHHMIEFEPIFTPGNEQMLHHFVVRRCPGFHPDLHMKNSECYLNWPKHFPDCPESFSAWAAGGGPFFFPENTGYSVGAPDDYSFYVMQIHYTNPAHKTGIIDNSGLRMRLTSKLRQHDVGSFLIGHSVTPYMIIPPHEKEFVAKGYCSEQCINEALHEKGVDEIRFVAALQHAHLLASGMITRHFRNGTELEPIGNDPFYDYYFQEYRTFNREIVVKKGDSFLVECNYNSMGRSSVSFGGLSTREEMCTTFVYHYPRLDRLACVSHPELGNVYNKTLNTGAAWAEFTSFMKTSFDWNDPEVKQNYTKLLEEVDYVHRCTGTDPNKPHRGSTQYIYKEDGPYSPYVQPKPSCSAK